MNFTNYFMKQKILLFVIAVATSIVEMQDLNAQNAYGGISVGYGMPLGGQDIYNETSTSTYNSDPFGGNTTSNSEYTSDRMQLSFGKGIQANAMVGYMMNPNLGFELGLSYLLGGKTEEIYEYSSSSIFTDGSRSSSSGLETRTYSARMFRVNPSVVISTGGELLSPYAKFGVIVGSGTMTIDYLNEETDTYSDLFGSDSEVYTEEYTYELSSGYAVGMSGAVGVMSKGASGISFFGELFMENVKYAPKKGEYTVYKEDGLNLLSLLTTSETETEFVDNYTSSSTDVESESKPSQERRESYAFGNVGVRMGVMINF
jgi:hypothetical protein